MKLYKVISINLFLLILFLLIADFSTAFIRRRNNLERVSARQIHAFFHHGFIPNATFKHNWIPEQSLKEKVNRFGFRANISEKSVAKIQDYKTVLIGDSFAEGVGVENKKIIASLLPKQFWPVANLGVMSHSPYLSRNRLDFYKERGLSPKKIIHLIDPSDFQDELHYWKVEGFRPPKNKFIKSLVGKINDSYISSSFTWEAFLTISWLLNSESFIRSIELYKYWDGSENYYRDRNPFKTDNEPFYYEEAKDRLLHQIELSIKNNSQSKYIIVIYQWPPFINSSNFSNQLARFNNYKKELELITSKFKNASICNADNANLNNSDFIDGDVHWNESGHKKIAAYISKKCL